MERRLGLLGLMAVPSSGPERGSPPPSSQPQLANDCLRCLTMDVSRCRHLHDERGRELSSDAAAKAGGQAALRREADEANMHG